MSLDGASTSWLQSLWSLWVQSVFWVTPICSHFTIFVPGNCLDGNSPEFNIFSITGSDKGEEQKDGPPQHGAETSADKEKAAAGSRQESRTEKHPDLHWRGQNASGVFLYLRTLALSKLTPHVQKQPGVEVRINSPP